MSDKWNNSDFVASAIIGRLSEGIWPLEEEATFLDSQSLIDGLRRQITNPDLPWLLARVQSDSDVLAGLACSLLRRHVTVPGVGECLRARWSTASSYLRNRIMWRLVDDESLSLNWLPIFREFVFANWTVFAGFNRLFFGSPDKALFNLLSRIVDPSFTDDPGAAKALLCLGSLLPDDFAREVAGRLLVQFYPEQNSNKAT